MKILILLYSLLMLFLQGCAGTGSFGYGAHQTGQKKPTIIGVGHVALGKAIGKYTDIQLFYTGNSTINANSILPKFNTLDINDAALLKYYGLKLNYYVTSYFSVGTFAGTGERFAILISGNEEEFISKTNAAVGLSLSFTKKIIKATTNSYNIGFDLTGFYSSKISSNEISPKGNNYNWNIDERIGWSGIVFLKIIGKGYSVKH